MPNIAYLDFYYEKTATVNQLYEDALTFTARTDGFILELNADSPDDNIYHFNVSYDNGMTWTAITFDTDVQTYYSFNEINAGESIMINGTNVIPFWDDELYFSCNAADKLCDLSGNIMTLINPTTYNTITTIPYNYHFKELFYGLPIVDASRLKLPATTLKAHCYEGMFKNCTSLTSAPVLPATTLANSCYNAMFYNCTSLTTAPQLLETALAHGCYVNMFSKCTSLTTPPALPAVALTPWCYADMFSECTSLTIPPVLPATTLAQQCYSRMFDGCTSLTTAPELPATTLAQQCYVEMFKNCTSLTSAPVLPATTLASECYVNMFNGCTNLNYIRILCTESNPSTSNLADWVSNVAPTGTFIKDANATYLIDNNSGVPIGWTVYNEGENLPVYYNVIITVDGSGTAVGGGVYEYEDNVTLTAQPAAGYIFDGWYVDYLLVSSNTTYTFTVTEDVNITAKFIIDPTVYYNVALTQDPEIGAVLTGAGIYEEGSYVTITASDVEGFDFVGWVYNGATISSSNSYSFNINHNMTFTATYEAEPVYHTITLNSSIQGAGTLVGAGTYLEGTNVTIRAISNDGYVFSHWLYNGAIYSTSDTATIVVDNNMTFTAVFEEVDNSHNYLTFEVISTPNTESSTSLELICDNTTTIEYKYNNNSWQTIDLYSGSNLIRYLRRGDIIKFRNLDTSNLNTVRFESSRDPSWGINVYGNIMSLFASHFDSTNSSDNYYSGLNLNTLLSTDIFGSTESPSYRTGMFSNVSVVDASKLLLPATVLTQECYGAMFKNCNTLTAAPELPATTLAVQCYSCMFVGCTSLTTAPTLHATTLAQACCASMFQGCRNLTSAPVLPATTLARECYEFMFIDCTSLTTAPELPATTLAYNCYFQMFGGCRSLTTAPALPATTLAEYCYTGMFSGCTSLTTAPQLPATTLVPECYLGMFADCTSLNNITCLATDISAYDCLDYWVDNVSSNGTFTKAATMTSWPTGANGIPSGWTVQDAS